MEETAMAERKDSPNRPYEGGDSKMAGKGNDKSAGKGGGRSASSDAKAGEPSNTTVRREKASPSERRRGEGSAADRA
jgi:hypothetical protein